MNYYLAIDIGASSGRHILCSMQDGKLVLEEVYRFNNNVVKKEGHYHWDIDNLFDQIKTGLKECKKVNKIPKTMAIDTWAVDYALLDQSGQPLNGVYAYRDSRNDNGVKTIQSKIAPEKLYGQTGLQFQKFNTIYQLSSEDDRAKKEACDFLMVPDYLNYLLTGEMANEYTNMSTTQLLDIKTNQLDESLVELTGFNPDIFKKMVMPGTKLGHFAKDIAGEVGFDCEVVVPATHDTGSAYMAAIEANSIILSSGTWSLLGIESLEPIVNEAARLANFTNEGGYNYRYRFLKNIMGLWIIQEVAREYHGEYGFGQLVEMARQEPFEEIFDVNDDRFLKPENMIEEIIAYFKERDQSYPKTAGEIAYCVYNSLAHCYKEAIDELEAITGKEYGTINIIGGGCQNILLNEMIAATCNKRVVAGPIEATALGNILSQLISDGVVNSLEQGRQLIRDSFEIKTY